MPRANRQPKDDPRIRACITINEGVLAQARVCAEQEGRSFSNLVEWLLRSFMAGNLRPDRGRK